jgi:phage terminase large subunit-like protein
MQYPARWTRPLVQDERGWAVHSNGPDLIRLIETRWTFGNGRRPVLDEWQRFFLTNALEVFPPEHPLAGRLRFRAVLFSAARQQGKSTLAAWISLYLMVQHVMAPNIIGISETREHGKVIYGQLLHAINNDVGLNKVLKPTSTRGIGKRNGTGAYNLYPAKEGKLQGLATTGALIDEVHLLPRQAWDSLVNGQAAQQDSIIFGLTTAGDDTSDLLSSLYERANAAIADPQQDPRFGAFIWEAPADAALDNVEAIHAANPAIECGRIDLATRLKDVENEPEFTRRRYLHNRFVSSLNPALDPGIWRDLVDTSRDEKDRPIGLADLKADGVFIGVDVAPKNSHATMSAARKAEDGTIEVTTVWSMANPTHDQMKAVADAINSSPLITVSGWVMDAGLVYLQDHLRGVGQNVQSINSASADTESANLMYALMQAGRIRHDGNDRVASQLGRAIAKNKGDSWRLAAPKPGVPLDALHSVVFAMYAAELYEGSGPLIRVHHPKAA